MQRLKNLVSKGSFFFFANAFSLIARFLLTIIISNFFSKSEFAIWAVLLSSVSIVSYVGDLGITNSLRNKLSKLQASNDDNDKLEMNYFISTFINIALISICVFIIIYSFNIEYENLFNSETEEVKFQVIELFNYALFIVLFTIPFGIGNAAFFSYNDLNKNAVFVLIQSLASLLLVLVLVWLKKSIVVVSISYLLFQNISFLLMFLYFMHVRSWSLAFILKNFSNYKKTTKELFSSGIKYFLFDSSRNYIENIGTILVSTFLNTAIAAEFNLLLKFYNFINGIIISVLNPLWAKISFKMELLEISWCNRIYKNGLALLFLIYSCFITFAIYFGNDLLRLFVGANYFFKQDLILLIGFYSFSLILFTFSTIFLRAIGNLFRISIVLLASIAIMSLSFTIFNIPYTLNSIVASLSSIWVIGLIFSIFIWKSTIKIESKIKV